MKQTYIRIGALIFTGVVLSVPARSNAQSQLASSDAHTPQGIGPYKAIRDSAFELPTHTLYRPASLNALPKRMKLPIVAWGNGSCANSSQPYDEFLTNIASYGFLIVAIGPAIESSPPIAVTPASTGSDTPSRPRGPRTQASQLLDGITWAVAENERDGSPLKGRIDTAKIAVAGHSCGGIQAIEVSRDPRITTTLALNSGIFDPPRTDRPPMGTLRRVDLATLHGSIAYFSGGPEDILYNNATADARSLTIPGFGASLTAAGHGDVYSGPLSVDFTRAVVGWLQYQLQGDAHAKKLFVGKSCGLCTDPKWQVIKQSKLH